MTDGLTGMMIGDIVAHDLRSAAVLARYGLDFCCGGRQSLEDACRSHGVDPGSVRRDLETLERENGGIDATTWPVWRLIDHIVDTHHAYVKRQIPVLRLFIEKLVAAHGDRRPELARVAGVFGTLSDELERHMAKEECILFPFIRRMTAASEGAGRLPSTPFGTVGNPIRMMEQEHRQAASELGQLRGITRNFQPPDDACATWRALYAGLAEFERDLHQHVHLENNVLFPAAAWLEQTLR